MARRHKRWRNRRNTLPARRRRRRHHRRDVQRGSSYEPLPIHNSMARRAVRDRLWLGVLAVGFAAFCGLLVIAGTQTSFGTAALSAFGFTSLSFAVASLLSARREESVHRLANHLEEPGLLEEASDAMGADGTP